MRIYTVCTSYDFSYAYNKVAKMFDCKTELNRFLLQALIGSAFFGETLSLMWCVGATFIVTGLAFIHKGKLSGEEKESKKLK